MQVCERGDFLSHALWITNLIERDLEANDYLGLGLDIYYIIAKIVHIMHGTWWTIEAEAGELRGTFV